MPLIEYDLPDPEDQELAEFLAAWPNCPTPDCAHKVCDWGGFGLCFKCSEYLVGKEGMIYLYEAINGPGSWDDDEED